MQETNVLIIGAGPSGSIVASYLNQQGFNVTSVEKMKFPRFVIGESLLPTYMDLLDEANLLDAVKAANFQEKFEAKFINGDKTCDFNFEEQYTPGWTWTWQVPREDFYKILAKTVASRGVDVQFETTVEAVNFIDDHVVTSVTSASGSAQIKSRFIIDSSGYGRVLPRLLDLDAPSDFPSRSAFFTHFCDTQRPNNIDGNRIQVVVLKQDVWVWIIPFSNGNTSFGVVGDLSFLDETKTNEENLRNLIESNEFLKERIGTVEFTFDPKMISGYSTSVKRFFGDKFVLTGNSTEFLDPVFSSGVTLALESGLLAAKLVARQLNGARVDWDQKLVAYIKRGVDTFRLYVSGWYHGKLQTIFFADEIHPEIKKEFVQF